MEELFLAKEGAARIMDGQSDDLIVKEISSKKIEIVWAGDEEADKPRVMSISFDLEPRVGVVLPVNPKPKSENSKLVYTDKKEQWFTMIIKRFNKKKTVLQLPGFSLTEVMITSAIAACLMTGISIVFWCDW